MKTVALIVPAETYRAEAFLHAAKRLQIDVVVVSDHEQALAKIMGDHFLRAPLHDPVQTAALIAELSSRLALDAVVAVDDGGAMSAALAGERLGLVHNAPSAIAATRDKAVMRDLLDRARVSQPRYVIARVEAPHSIGELVGKAADSIGYPVVIKPSSLSASRGVIRANDRPSAQRAGVWASEIARTADAAHNVTLIVEEFVAGDEVALEGRLKDGALDCLALFDKPDPLDGPYFEETIYVTPSRLAMDDQQAVIDNVSQACRAIGLQHGPIHAEVRLRPSSDDGSKQVVFLEVAARTIGGRCAKALQFAGGVSLEEIVLADSLDGARSMVEREASPSGVMMLPVSRGGRLIQVANQDTARAIPGVTSVEITVSLGRVLRPFPESDRYLGFVFARAATPDAVVAALRAAESKLDVQIEDDYAESSAAHESVSPT